MKEKTIINHIENNKDNSVVFNCRTIESIEKLAFILDKLGIEFENMRLYSDTAKDIMMAGWHAYRKEICFRVYTNKIVTFSDRLHFKRLGFKPIVL